jgi:hypothetical protein
LQALPEELIQSAGRIKGNASRWGNLAQLRALVPDQMDERLDKFAHASFPDLTLDDDRTASLCGTSMCILRCPLVLFCWIGEWQALLADALAGLNLRVVCGKSLTFEKLCLPRTKRLVLMVRGWLRDRTHAHVSLF